MYGGHDTPSQVLLHLYSLRLDLGKANFEEYRQLALATAIVSAKRAFAADITPRAPLKLVINGDRRQPVNTREPGRELDKNDHIINFLNENTIEEEVVVRHREVVPEPKYDERGIAIPAPKGKKPKRVPVIDKRRRPLYACDVMAGKALQERFNAYMKSKGHPVELDCGDRVIHWNSHDAVHGQQRKNIAAACKLFRAAYEAKGLLPAQRDPAPSPASGTSSSAACWPFGSRPPRSTPRTPARNASGPRPSQRPSGATRPSPRGTPGRTRSRSATHARTRSRSSSHCLDAATGVARSMGIDHSPRRARH